MLKDLLDMLNRGKAVSVREIAEARHCGVETVRAGLDYLERQGYIKKVSLPSCQGKSCYGCKGCTSRLPLPLMWEKT